MGSCRVAKSKEDGQLDWTGALGPGWIAPQTTMTSRVASLSISSRAGLPSSSTPLSLLPHARPPPLARRLLDKSAVLSGSGPRGGARGRDGAPGRGHLRSSASEPSARTGASEQSNQEMSRKDVKGVLVSVWAAELASRVNVSRRRSSSSELTRTSLPFLSPVCLPPWSSLCACPRRLINLIHHPV